MNMNEKLEFIMLEKVLNDTIFCKYQRRALIEDMYERFSVLRDKFLKQYELPNLVKDPLTD